MPARKDSSLNKRHVTKSEEKTRKSAEAAVKPKTQISAKPPAMLKGHKIACAVWTRTIKLYGETQGTLITAFDETLLMRYCLAVDDLSWWKGLRDEVEKTYRAAKKKLANAKTDDMQAYYNALSQVNALLARLQGFDARLDGKGKYILSLEQSLYLTPRSRAGAAPEEKEPEKPKSEMDNLLD